MGKWTLDYTDDVLHSKISSLVSGAIRRAAVEKEPSISYENFVNDLDVGDSFTTSLIDILVKEVADRRTRATLNDRRLISDRTLRSLRALASNHRVQPNRLPNRNFSRRTINGTDFLSAPPNDMDLEDEEEILDAAMDTGDVEGVRINPSLFDAFNPNRWGGPVRLSAAADDWYVPVSARTTGQMYEAPSSMPSASLARQPPIRRARSRLVDFSDALTRRRQAREAMAVRLPESSTDSSESNIENHSSTRRHYMMTRRSNPPSALPPPSDTPPYVFHAPAAGEWYLEGSSSVIPSPDTQSPAPDTREEDEMLIRAPRLRRGGVRAPESILPRRASLIPIGRSAPSPSAPTPPPERAIAVHSLSSEPTQPLLHEEPVAYPTPGASENENSS